MKLTKTDTPIDLLLDYAYQKMGATSAKEFYFRSGFDQATVSRIRNNLRQASPDVVLRLYDLTGISVDEIRARLGMEKFVPQKSNATLPATQAAQN